MVAEECRRTGERAGGTGPWPVSSVGAVVGDPFQVLGLTRQASLEEVRAARRVLARQLHPDMGGDIERMQEVNVAFEAAVAHLTGRRAAARRARRADADRGAG